MKPLSVVAPALSPPQKGTGRFDKNLENPNPFSLTKSDSEGLLTPPPSAHPHSPCFHKYEKMMDIIRSRGPGDVWPWDIPWPILPRSVHSFPVKGNHSLLAKDMVGNSMQKFIESYASYRAHPVHLVRSTMQTDWTSIVDKTPFWRFGQKEMVELIVYHLTDSV
jgi:hypothetical protein